MYRYVAYEAFARDGFEMISSNEVKISYLISSQAEVSGVLPLFEHYMRTMTVSFESGNGFDIRYHARHFGPFERIRASVVTI